MVSIIIPVYNVKDYINRCMDSVLAQTYKDIEVIAVDDESTDGTLAILREYEKKDSRVKVYTEEHQGVSAARNLGKSKSTGEYIMFVDSDDYIDSRMVDGMLKAMKDYDADISICMECAFVNNDEPDIEQEKENDSYLFSRTENIEEVLLHFADEFTGYVGWTWNKLYKRSVINDISYASGRILEDIIFNAQVLSKINKAVWLDNRYYCYRQRKGSLMNSGDTKVYTDFAYALYHERKYIYPKLKDEQKGKIAGYILRKLAKLEKSCYRKRDIETSKVILAYYKKIYKDIKYVSDYKEKLKIWTFRYFRGLYHKLPDTKKRGIN